MTELQANFEVPPQLWTPPEPRELPALRQALAEDTRSPLQHQALVQMLALGRGTLSPNTGDLGRDASILLDGELKRLRDAVLYYVSADMTRLAMAAAETLPVHSFNAADVPSEAGFLVFAEPIAAYLPDAGPGVDASSAATIVAASWGSLAGTLPGPPGVWLTFWAISDCEAEARALHGQGVPLSKARERSRTIRAELTWDNEVTFRFGAPEVAILGTENGRRIVRAEPIDTAGGAWDQIKGTTAGWAHVVRATWLLMTQPGVTDVEEQPPSRTVRRRAEREGYNPSAVRVVRIRHHENTPSREEEPAGRTYRVRWTVRGHWRNQWYSSRQEHRPVWINPHIKGPEDAPLRTGETVHLLDS